MSTIAILGYFSLIFDPKIQIQSHKLDTFVGDLLILQRLTMSFCENSNMGYIVIAHMGSKWLSFAQRLWRGEKFLTRIFFSAMQVQSSLEK